METALVCLELIARVHQINLDLRTLKRDAGIPGADLSKEELLRAAKVLGFKARLKSFPLEKLLPKYPTPFIAILKDESFAVFLKANEAEKTALVFLPREKSAKQLSYNDFGQLWDNESIVLKHSLISSEGTFGFKWFFNEILHYKQIIGQVLLGSFIVQLFGFVTPLFTQVILDKVIVHRSMTTLDVLAVAFLAVMVFELFLNLARNYVFVHTAKKIDAKLGAKLFKHLLSLPYIYFEMRQVGNIVARVRELDNIREFITNRCVSVVVDLFFSLAFVMVMFIYSVKLSLVFLAFVLLVGILYLSVTPELRKRLQHKFIMAAQSNSYLVESVTGMHTVKSLALEGAMQRKWEDNLGKYVHSGFKLANMANISGAISGLFQRLMTIVVLYLGVKLVIDNQLTIGQLIAFQMFSGLFTGPFMRLLSLWNEFQQALLSVERIGDILNNPLESKKGHDITLAKIKGDLRFENISFKYNQNSKDALSGMSFNIKAGTSVGLVGRSGSGKSTVTKLIERLYIPSEGAIYVDDIDLRHMSPSWLRYHMGVVLQEDFLFSGTIRENIALPRSDAPMEAIIEVAKIAGAHQFISEMPMGYDTLVGERGSTLSGGQKQRIAIARALITNPRIFILDEATSSLDYESERLIQKNLSKIIKGRTTFIVAHRLSTVKNCDIIIALDNGKIVESGTHEALMRKKGYYWQLCMMQEGEGL
ncbi:MAG: type I secretion system permease/ATPase [Desulfobacterales bacterium]|jgi:subfamily B ATP-binding cassette protein HlyB/CyaB|nr:type I secretion system permease/ATPase [Desulfobacterales bacterium]